MQIRNKLVSRRPPYTIKSKLFLDTSFLRYLKLAGVAVPSKFCILSKNAHRKKCSPVLFSTCLLLHKPGLYLIKTAMRLNLGILFIYAPTHFTRLAPFPPKLLCACAKWRLKSLLASATFYSVNTQQSGIFFKNLIRNHSLIYSAWMYNSFLIRFFIYFLYLLGL